MHQADHVTIVELKRASFIGISLLKQTVICSALMLRFAVRAIRIPLL